MNMIGMVCVTAFAASARIAAHCHKHRDAPLHQPPGRAAAEPPGGCPQTDTRSRRSGLRYSHRLSGSGATPPSPLRRPAPRRRAGCQPQAEMPAAVPTPALATRPPCRLGLQRCSSPHARPYALRRAHRNRYGQIAGRAGDVRSGCAPWKGGVFQWVQAPPGNRSSRKRSEQSWR